MAERATTDKQQRILDVIRAFSSEHGYPPSVREIGERVGLSSSSTVQSHLKTLERRGLLRRDPTKPRALVAARDEDEPITIPSVTLPIVGRVAAGVPITAAENLEDHFVLPTSWAPRSGRLRPARQGRLDDRGRDPRRRPDRGRAAARRRRTARSWSR